LASKRLSGARLGTGALALAALPARMVMVVPRCRRHRLFMMVIAVRRLIHRS
jgi:hypothetical protein